MKRRIDIYIEISGSDLNKLREGGEFQVISRRFFQIYKKAVDNNIDVFAWLERSDRQLEVMIKDQHFFLDEAK